MTMTNHAWPESEMGTTPWDLVEGEECGVN